MSHPELFKSILKRKYWIISVFVVAAIITTIYEWRTPYQYKSSVKFFIEEYELYSTELNLTHSSPENRIFHFIKSSEVFDHLVNKFSLYDHYHIDDKSPQHYEIINAILNDRIEVKSDIRNAIIITVKDEDKYRAADMANEIYNKVNEMNRDFVISVAEKKIKVYEEIISSSKTELTGQVMEFNGLIDDTKKLLTENKFQRNEAFVYDMRMKLSSLSSQLSTINDDLLKNIKAYELARVTTQKENINSLRLVNTALPDINNPVHVSLFAIAAYSFAAVFFTILGIVIYYEYRGYFNMIFSKA